MKKLFVIAMFAALCVAAQNFPSPSVAISIPDAVAIQSANIAALDAKVASDKADFAAKLVRYSAQRNSMVAQLDKLQTAAKTNAPAIISNPPSSTP